MRQIYRRSSEELPRKMSKWTNKTRGGKESGEERAGGERREERGGRERRVSSESVSPTRSVSGVEAVLEMVHNSPHSLCCPR